MHILPRFYNTDAKLLLFQIVRYDTVSLCQHRKIDTASTLYMQL